MSKKKLNSKELAENVKSSDIDSYKFFFPSALGLLAETYPNSFEVEGVKIGGKK